MGKIKDQAMDYFVRIPDGHKNAIQRPWNRVVDRCLRGMIEKANNNGDCIINVGNGIYRPIPGDPVDEKELDEYEQLLFSEEFSDTVPAPKAEEEPAEEEQEVPAPQAEATEEPDAE